MRILALDFGDSRIGVAVSDPTGTIASPITTIRRVSQKRDIELIADLIEQHSAERVVVGLPRTLRGEIGPQAERVMRFGEALSLALPVPVVYWDETYSTVDAEEILHARAGRRRSRGSRRGLDEVAAAVILQSYLAGQGGGAAG